MKIRKDDTVIVLSGNDRGKKGKVLRTEPATGKVVVEGINMVTCHTKPRRQGEAGGIIRKEAGIRANKVMRICPKCGAAVRMGYTFLEDGTKARVCKKCKAVI